MARIVIALGGNALGNNPTEQISMVEAASVPIASLIMHGHEVVISHGNGPQVGMILKAFELASKTDSGVPMVELPECCAMSQGYISFHLQNAIKKELTVKGDPRKVATIITQMIVDKNDPAFKAPSKPIGSFYDKAYADKAMKDNPGIVFAEDSGRGYRRMVPSPSPVGIVEKTAILTLIENKFITIACGGGGIPVIQRNEGDFVGVPAVVDKDFSSAKLAELVSADYLFILTAVERVAINFGKPTQKSLEQMNIAEAEQYIKEGHFAPGSMLPKVEAALAFVKTGNGRKAVICALEKAEEAVRGESGTLITEK